jgi:hypothetical protein
VIKTRVGITGESDEIMTGSSEFKALVRERMEITGESYTQAMREILATARTAVPEKSRPPRSAVRPWVPRPWDPPESEIPAIVPIDTLQFAQSGQAAIAITGIAAYSQGIEIFVAQRIRPDAPGFDEDPSLVALTHPQTEPQSFKISLRLADGSEVISARSGGDAKPAGPILRPRGGGGSAHSVLMRWWAWPLPPKGPLEFACRWPLYGIAETRIAIDAQLILDAAQRSIRLWPEYEGSA